MSRLASQESWWPLAAEPARDLPREASALDNAGAKAYWGPVKLVHARVEAALERHLALVWRVLRRAGLGPADADDAVQDVFWVLAQRIDRVPQRAERSFLVTTALRVAADRRRSAWHRSVTEPLDPEAWDPDTPAPDEVVLRRQGLRLLDQALESLEPADREVFLLVELEEMSRTEAAEILETPPGTVASRLRRAREAFSLAVRRLERETGRSK
jgi:RNA polymerase sigma-70 factor (ECF subfamily)